MPPQNPQQQRQRPPTAKPAPQTQKPVAPPERSANGTPPRGNLSRRRSPAQAVTLSTPRPARAVWWKRWPAWIGAIAIFLLGLSAGMLIERARQPGGATAEATSPLNSPGAGAEMMPTNPLPPPKRAAPTTPPGALPPSSSPPTGSPPSSSPPPSFRGAAPVTAFVDKLVDTSCDKLVSCGVMPGQTKKLCASMFEDFRDPDADDKVASGVCRFDASAANNCLRQIARVDCSRVSTDMADIAKLLAGPLVTCQRAFECR